MLVLRGAQAVGGLDVEGNPTALRTGQPSDDAGLERDRIPQRITRGDRIGLVGPRIDTPDGEVAYDGDARRGIADPAAPYYGVQVTENSLVPGPGARVGLTRFDWWLTHVPPPRNMTRAQNPEPVHS